jgi:uncharacterized protein (DUF1697 family)
MNKYFAFLRAINVGHATVNRNWTTVSKIARWMRVE